MNYEDRVREILKPLEKVLPQRIGYKGDPAIEQISPKVLINILVKELSQLSQPSGEVIVKGVEKAIRNNMSMDDYGDSCLEEEDIKNVILEIKESNNE